MLLLGELKYGSSIFSHTFFVDCGADDCFIDKRLTQKLKIPTIELKTPIKLQLANGEASPSGLLTSTTIPLQMRINDHTEIHYLGYIISAQGIKMDPSKVQVIQDWPTPKNVHDIQVFLGFTNFYRTLIHDYSNKTCKLTNLLKKDVPFEWGIEQEVSFKALKNTFSQDTLLSHPNEDKLFLVETDASDCAISGILSQFDENQILKPIAFYSRQMVPAERNYEIYDKELLAVIESFKHWRHFLQGGRHQITVLCDHKNLEYFMSTKKLTRRQARWSLELAEFDFILTHRPGRLNGKADLLSRRPDYKIDDEKQNLLQLIKPEQVMDLNQILLQKDCSALIRSNNLNIDFDMLEDWPLIIADFLESGDNSWLPDIPSFLLNRCKNQASQFAFKNDIFVRILDNGLSTAPFVKSNNRTNLIERFHHQLAHLKFDSIIELLTRRYWWPNMKSDVRDYIARCPQCQLNSSASGVHAPTPLRPITPTALPFERWGIDFVGRLPETKSGNKFIITAIDYATRWVVAKPIRNMNESAVASFLYSLMMDYGTPYEIISDRGKSFLAEGIKEFENRNQITHLATTPYHPQTNGMVERMHSMLGAGLSSLLQGRTDRWDEYLNQTIFAIRVRTHAVTGFSPFFLLYGVHPRLPSDTNPPEQMITPLDELEQIEVNNEFIARTMEELGESRAAANVRTKTQAELMRKRNNLEDNNQNYYFKVGDMVKMKHHNREKFEFSWKGPYHIVDIGFPGTYWIMTPQGQRLPATINQSELAPWITPVKDNTEFFYDKTSRFVS